MMLHSYKSLTGLPLWQVRVLSNCYSQVRISQVRPYLPYMLMPSHIVVYILTLFTLCYSLMALQSYTRLHHYRCLLHHVLYMFQQTPCILTISLSFMELPNLASVSHISYSQIPAQQQRLVVVLAYTSSALTFTQQLVTFKQPTAHANPLGLDNIHSNTLTNHFYTALCHMPSLTTMKVTISSVILPPSQSQAWG